MNIKDMTVEQLNKLSAEIEAELKSRVSTKRITISFDAYNERRYSRPWIAKVTSWPIASAPKIEFGRYLGDSFGGVAEIEAIPGDIIRAGQKDGRGGNGANDWYIVDISYNLSKITESEARNLWKGKE